MKIFEAAPPEVGPSLALHGGAGGRVEELTLEGRAPYSEGLIAAYSAGWQVLASGGSALDAVCASVEVLENDPLFNAGRGAALTATGHAELDASVKTGAGRAGAVAACKHAKNPVLLARAVMEHTEHALIVDPDAAFLECHGFQPVDRGYFITESRQQQLLRGARRPGGRPPPRNGRRGRPRRRRTRRRRSLHRRDGRPGRRAGRGLADRRGRRVRPRGPPGE